LASGAVLDASALLALMRNEEGAARVAALLPEAVISAVNLAEAETGLIRAGLSQQEAWWHIAQIGCTTVAFDEEQARIAGGLAGVAGLSLGDRACLALALARKATVYTADVRWRSLNVKVPIEIIRS
jgi:ribonuclease VapC